MAYPNQLANGVGNLIDATALMANFNAALQKAGDTVTGVLTLGTGAELAVSSSTQISSNMSVAGKMFLNNQGNTSLTIQGFATGDTGQIVFVTNNTGGGTLTFVAAGTGTKVFLLPGNVNLVLQQRAAAIFAYDTNASGWFCIGYSSGTGQDVGTGTNDNANAGNVGERISSAVQAVSGSASATFSNITSISLTAGDWDLSGFWVANNTVVTSTGNAAGYISAYSGNVNTDATIGDNQWYGGVGALNGAQYNSYSLAGYRVSLSATTTYYLKGMQTYSAGTPSWNGRISARRLR